MNTLSSILRFIGVRGILLGEIRQYAGASEPTGWKFCNGQELSKSDYAGLYAVIGDGWGTASDNTKFCLPDFRNRMPVGAGGLYQLKASGGSKDAVVVSHNHGGATGWMSANATHSHQLGRNKNSVANGSRYDKANDSTATSDRGYLSTSANINHTHSIAAAGESGTDKNMPPYTAVNFIIYAG